MRLSDPILDLIALAVPDHYDPEDPEQRPALMTTLDQLANATIARQYQGPKRPRAVVIEETDWLVTRDVEEAKAFQPAHDCPTCLAGHDQVTAFLKEHPRTWMALGNLTYREVW